MKWNDTIRILQNNITQVLKNNSGKNVLRRKMRGVERRRCSKEFENSVWLEAKESASSCGCKRRANSVRSMSAWYTRTLVHILLARSFGFHVCCSCCSCRAVGSVGGLGWATSDSRSPATITGRWLCSTCTGAERAARWPVPAGWEFGA